MQTLFLLHALNHRRGTMMEGLTEVWRVTLTEQTNLRAITVDKNKQIIISTNTYHVDK